MKTTATDINGKRRSGLFMPIDEALVDSFSWLTTLLGLDNEEGGERGGGGIKKKPSCYFITYGILDIVAVCEAISTATL